MTPKVSNLMKMINPQAQAYTHTHKYTKKTSLWNITNKLLKISDKEKILETRVMGETHYKQKNKEKDVSRFSVRNNTSKRTGVSIFKVLFKKKKVNLGFHNQGKLLSKMKANRS